MIILTATRAGHLIDRLFHQEMTNSSAQIRYETILKFQNFMEISIPFSYGD